MKYIFKKINLLIATFLITCICKSLMLNVDNCQNIQRIQYDNEKHSEIITPNSDSSSEIIQKVKNIIVENETRISDKGDSVVEILEGMKEVYSENTDVPETLNSLIAELDEEIELYSKYKSNNINFQNNNFAEDLEKNLYRVAITSIIAGFYADFLFLSGELLSHMLNNQTRDSDYYPVFGTIVKGTNLIYQIASDDTVVGHAKFDKPNYFGYVLPEVFSRIETDAYNALGEGFMYEKQPLSDEKVILNICDRYDFDPGKSGLLDFCYQAQEKGVLTPFYTKIYGLNVTGKVQFGYEIKNNQVIITQSGNTENVVIPSNLPQFAYISDVDNEMPLINVSRIQASAFENNKIIKNIYISSGISYIEANAFNGCDNMTIEVDYGYRPLGWSSIWNGNNTNILWLKEHNHEYEYRYVGEKGHIRVCCCSEQKGEIEPHIVSSIFVKRNKNYSICEKCGCVFELKDIYIVDNLSNKY